MKKERENKKERKTLNEIDWTISTNH